MEVRSIDIPPEAVPLQGCQDLISLDKEEESYRESHGLPLLATTLGRGLQTNLISSALLFQTNISILGLNLPGVNLSVQKQAP